MSNFSNVHTVNPTRKHLPRETIKVHLVNLEEEFDCLSKTRSLNENCISYRHALTSKPAPTGAPVWSFQSTYSIRKEDLAITSNTWTVNRDLSLTPRAIFPRKDEGKTRYWTNTFPVEVPSTPPPEKVDLERSASCSPTVVGVDQQEGHAPLRNSIHYQHLESHPPHVYNMHDRQFEGHSPHIYNMHERQLGGLPPLRYSMHDRKVFPNQVQRHCTSRWHLRPPHAGSIQHSNVTGFQRDKSVAHLKIWRPTLDSILMTRRLLLAGQQDTAMATEDLIKDGDVTEGTLG